MDRSLNIGKGTTFYPFSDFFHPGLAWSSLTSLISNKKNLCGCVVTNMGEESVSYQ